MEDVLALEPKDIRDKRDRAMLATAYSAMLRRSELVALEIRDLVFDPDGSGTATVIFFARVTRTVKGKCGIWLRLPQSS